MLYGHGDDLHAFEKAQITANFSTNVWPEGPHPLLLSKLAASIKQLDAYPEPAGKPFVEQLSAFYNVSAQHFLATNGTADAIYLIAQVFRKRTVTIFIPTFAEYEDAARLHQIECSFCNWNEIEKIPKLSTDLAFICHPNNPTGQIVATEILEAFIKKNPETLFIIDEAYEGFLKHSQSLLSRIDSFKNVLLLRSLTKLFALPGLRLGYISGHPSIIQKISEYKPPWSVNSLAVQAGVFIFQDYEMYLPDVIALLEETQWFLNEVKQIDGLEAMETLTNFFLVKSLFAEAKQLKVYLAGKGMLIRDAPNFRGLSPNYFRLATLQREKNQQLINELKLWNPNS